MDKQFIQELRDLWMEHGANLSGWPTAAKDRIAVSWYEYDERDASLRPKGIPDWMADALSELSMNPKKRGEILAAMKEYGPGNAIDPLQAIGIIVLARLQLYPLDTIAERLRELEFDFLGWQRENSERLEADSRNDAAAVS